MSSPADHSINISEVSSLRSTQNAPRGQQAIAGLVPNPHASTLARDALLAYAHRIYNTPFSPSVLGHPIPEPLPELTSPEHPYTAKLLPLLQNLQSVHPTHLPILLLLGCVHYATGNYTESKLRNEEILSLDGNYVSLHYNASNHLAVLNTGFKQVEAMCNLGTTCKAMNLVDEALYWWRKAISLRPSYWDAVVSITTLYLRA